MPQNIPEHLHAPHLPSSNQLSKPKQDQAGPQGQAGIGHQLSKAYDHVNEDFRKKAASRGEKRERGEA